jgi:hypothetical protein
MMRSFPTRLVSSATRTVLLIPCLLICLVCATPFPIENLEEGMTTETVRERFGAPEAMGPHPKPQSSYSLTLIVVLGLWIGRNGRSIPMQTLLGCPLDAGYVESVEKGHDRFIIAAGSESAPLYGHTH